MVVEIRFQVGIMTVTSLVLMGGMGIAGALGAATRYLISRFITERIRSFFPLATFFINITGAFLIGLTFALVAQHSITPALQSLLATGFLGGYTTFSTMSWEGVELLRRSSMMQSLLYLVGTFLLGLGAALVGILIGRGM
jgi:CrcB protein